MRLMRSQTEQKPSQTHVDDRGTTIAHSLSYLAAQSLARFLNAADQQRSGQRARRDREASVMPSTHLGTATSNVSMNSESPVVKSSLWTMSPNERVARLPL